MINVAGIYHNDLANGPNLRTVLFVQGCPHHCKGCHNPETWDYNVEKNIMSVEEVLNIFDSDSILAGITLSGGEPFSPCNFEEMLELCKAIKERKKNVWVFTGYTIDKLVEKYKKEFTAMYNLILESISKKKDIYSDF